MTTKQRPWNRIPLETELAVRKLIREGVAYVEICKRLKIGKSTVQRLVAASKPNGTQIQPPRPTTVCNHQPNCPCVYHAAEAWKREHRKPARVIGE